MNELMNVTVEAVDDVLVTTSNRVAEELEVNHRDLLEKIDGYIERFMRAESSALGRNSNFNEFYIPSTYKVDGNFKEYKNYLITEKGVAQLIGGYSAAVPKAFDLNVAYINEFDRMKKNLSAYKIPTTMKEVLLIALEQQERIEALQSENDSMNPKALFADAVSASHTSILIGDMAKLLKQNGIETGQKRLFEWLRENGYLMKTGSSKNMPTQRAMELGLFEVKESTISNPDGGIRVTKTTKVTGKGQVYFTNLFLEKAG